jgi:hypothetical protein
LVPVLLPLVRELLGEQRIDLLAFAGRVIPDRQDLDALTRPRVKGLRGVLGDLDLVSVLKRSTTSGYFSL